MVHTVTGDRGYTVAAVDHALDVLCAFERPPHEFGASELARQLGMTKNHVFRVLKTFEARGFVRRVEDRYMVGVRAFEVGQLAIQRLDVVRVARPLIHNLHQQTGETVHLAVLDPTTLEAVCIERIESHHPVRLSAEVGRRFPLHAGACPKVLLAFLPQAERDAVLDRGLPAFTRHTVTDAAELGAQLDEIRRCGYVVADEDLDVGAAAVAAPVRDWSGQVVAAISVAGPIGRVRDSLNTTLRLAVLAAAERISSQLGYSESRKGNLHAIASPA
ncbi:MAG TPA: IclR family transcriptional regulator [Chloroflexota bacterium]|jgi:DNA-binding IclR family transcriptional regulator|nr:IclR family transcriptional regulator [Chloroflexota bacterium]